MSAGASPRAASNFSVAVDIYHIAQGLPRFAFVAYTDAGSGLAAIDDLHLRPISMSSDFARENWADLDIWRRWDGRLTVVRSEPGRLVPRAVLSDFPNVPDWAVGGRKDEASPGRKRDRCVPDHDEATQTDDAERQGISRLTRERVKALTTALLHSPTRHRMSTSRSSPKRKRLILYLTPLRPLTTR